LADRHRVRELAVFESEAGGEATEASDLDLTVEFDPELITRTWFLDCTVDLEACCTIASTSCRYPRSSLRCAHADAEALHLA